MLRLTAQVALCLFLCKMFPGQIRQQKGSSRWIAAFARGVSRDAVEDAAKNLGLAMRMAEGCYPIRDTAYKSLLGRAKISGSALPKLKRDTLASVLNACLGLYGEEALLLIRDEKVTAVHAGDASDYSVLPINELLRALQNKLDERFPGKEFENGYCDHALVSASWSMPGQKDQPAARLHGPLGDIPYTVGGSDVAAIFGLSPWMTPLGLWKIKKGR